MRRFSTIILYCMLPGCAVLHHAQVGDVESSSGYTLRAFNVMVSEVGVNLEEGKNLAKSVTRNQKAKDTMESIYAIVSLFQQGPRTGNSVFNDTYAVNLVNELYKECPSGRITGLTSIRETRKYPVVSGEIVKINGFCLEKKS